MGVTFEMRPDKFLHKTRAHTLDNGLVVRTALRNDIPKLKKMSTSLFADSCFYHDPFFSKKEADTLFQAWIENSVLGDAADIFYYVPDKGFITCKKVNAKTEGNKANWGEKNSGQEELDQFSCKRLWNGLRSKI